VIALAVVAACTAFGEGTGAEDGPRVGDVYRPGDEAAFVFELAGQRFGEHWWTYVDECDLLGAKAHRFQGGVRIEQTTPLGKLEVRSTGDLWVDDLGHPLRFSMRTEAGGTRGSVELVFADGKATGESVQGPSRRPLTVAVPAGAYLLANNWIGALELVAALAPPQEGAPRKLDLFAVDAARVIPFELRHQGTFAGKRGEEAVEGEKYRDSLGEVLKIEKSGKLFEIELPAQGVRIRRTDEPATKITLDVAPPPRDDFVREEVTIEHGDSGSGGRVKLAGTITRKKGVEGRLPAVFFVSGSGSQDREGLAGGIDLGTHEILDRLTEEGFVVLRADDRGVGGSVGPGVDVSYDDLVADARACVDFLLARADVEAEHLFVLGHSEGGETAPILACERPLAGIVLMAAPGRSMFAIMRDQKRMALEDAGMPAKVVDSELEVHAKALELLTKPGNLDSEELRVDYRPEIRNRAWYQSHARHDPIAQIKLVKCPVLIAQGAKDLQVSAEKDAPALETALKEAKHPDVTLKVFAALDHLFKKVEGEKPSYQEYFKARPVDREFLDALVAWLKERAKR